MLSTTKTKGVLFLASCLYDGVEDSNINQITTLLKNNNADPNFLLPIHGITPFHLAVGHKCKEFSEKVVKLFLYHGGNPNVKSCDGITPVHVAAAWGRIEVLELLLTNGGNPLCLDDDNQSPFHYALDGNYYDAIDILRKHIINNKQFNDDKGKDEMKVQIKLEKILINHGDVIAEFVPSEFDVTNELSHKTKRNIIFLEKSDNLRKFQQINSKNTEKISGSISTLPNLNTDNITFRRAQKCYAKKNVLSILPSNNSILDFKKKSEASKKISIDKPRNISNTYNIYEKNNESEKISTLLSQQKYLMKNSNEIDSFLLDTSIVSKSPNLKIRKKKINQVTKLNSLHENQIPNCKEKPLTVKNNNLTTNVRRPLNIMTPKTKYMNSTIKLETNRKQYKYTLDENTIQTSGKTLPISDYNISLSMGDIETTSNAINKKKLYKNITRNLDTIMYNENCKNNSNVIKNNSDEFKQSKFDYNNSCNRSKFTKLINNIDTILGFDKVKMTTQQLKNNKLRVQQDIKSQKIDLNVNIKDNDIMMSLESPESSHRSYQYQSKYNSDSNEKLIIWNELDEIYKNKEQTPPTSISILVNDSFTNLNTSKSSSSIEIEADRDLISSCSYSGVNRNPLEYPIRSSIESFISLDEEYAYVDAEKDIAFMERRFCVSSEAIDMNEAMHESAWFNRNDKFSSTPSRISSRSSSEFDRLVDHGEFIVSNASLRHQLIAFGDNPGPITPNTNRVYLKRLYKLKRSNLTNLCLAQLQNEINQKSSRISRALLSTNWMRNLQPYQDLEESVFHEYEKPDNNNKYRGGIARTSFNYLLLDPRITKNLPRNGRDLSLAERWEIFLKAIFYVGKGKNTRPMAHLYESHEIWNGKKHNDKSNEKIQRILNIWHEGKGVVCHQVFLHSMQEEAFIREAAMIDALGTKHLCNCNRGNYYGLAATMSNKTKKDLGKYLLYKTMEILMNDGERQIFPRNIE
ncbi:hypothetical protein PV328_009159 [Microctonus aethiopoides]|uniref:LEM domain-containing protein n=1 Tax=Microctonus aethiopoides TaxID=144406 RepID=A0AA39EWM3_9HYME|nr:hypothetical protein PV328_009159 [Microctonus aethiopoides]